MDQPNDQMIAFNKAALQVAVRFAGIMFEGTEQMLELQMQAAKSAFSDGVQQLKALAEAKDLQELGQFRSRLAPPNLEKASDYLKSVYKVAAATQAELNKLVEEQVAELNKRAVTTFDQSAKSAPAGSEFAMAAFKSAISAVNTAYDNMSKTTRQLSQLSQANVEAAAGRATHAGRQKHA